MIFKAIIIYIHGKHLSPLPNLYNSRHYYIITLTVTGYFRVRISNILTSHNLIYFIDTLFLLFQPFEIVHNLFAYWPDLVYLNSFLGWIVSPFPCVVTPDQISIFIRVSLYYQGKLQSCMF